jgi:cytochrome c553
MKIVCLRAALPILAIVFGAPCHAENTDARVVSKQDLQAKIDFCQTCHGQTGQGFHGFYPIPRLAGQPTEVIENQLRAFLERRRTNNIMFNVARVLSPAMITALASYFRELDPQPIGGAPKELITAGKKIYEEGIPDAGVPACSSCHGPEAKGDRQFPRLAGQLHDYIFKKLTNWNRERGQNPAEPDTSAVMQPIAQSLTEPQIKAVAAYLNYLQ